MRDDCGGCATLADQLQAAEEQIELLRGQLADAEAECREAYAGMEATECALESANAMLGSMDI